MKLIFDLENINTTENVGRNCSSLTNVAFLVHLDESVENQQHQYVKEINKIYSNLSQKPLFIVNKENSEPLEA